MLELFHFTRKGHVAPILIHGLYPSAKFHDLGLEMRRNAVYCWLSPDDDRMGYAANDAYECLRVLVEADRCMVADMDLATQAFQYMRGLGGKERDLDLARHYAELYRSTAVPVTSYRPGLFGAPEVLVKGPVAAGQLDAVKPSGLPFVEGQSIPVAALRYDGTPYRWWEARVERITSGCIVTFAPAGGVVHQPDGDWHSRVSVRTFYWPDRGYNLSECYDPEDERSGSHERSSLYVHIASRPHFVADGIRYHDYELDVSKSIGQPARVLDEDEFQEAAGKYGYSSEFQASCRAGVEESLRLVDEWIWPYRSRSN